ncbi:MAG: hypothetical protein JKY96_01835, partial [Phycisphaerales bacterium]|nr:hypothetical protein [Phycisphaerales bacterium]
MSTQILHPDRPDGSSKALVLGCALGLSLVLHMAAGFSVWEYSNSSATGVSPDLEELLATMTPPPLEKIELGIDESESASINWLGVIDEPQ